MGFVDKLKNWVSFRSMITPIILKVVYQILFILLNIAGIVAVIGLPLMTALGGLAANDSGAMIMAFIGAIFMFIAGVLLLVLYNIFLRMYFEIILLLFNIHDELKAINNNTKKGE